ncbi:diguanylate cyclase [Echinicola strongylocentroti]|uniref:Diguanylate cyclase n=1 Tax=Echinicola strongylocentroti TaxID=1795355 RepID=A0A2Z4INX4_9BACT|nr:PAS domain-containing protein [Echinicola strongylocentroti]AWW32033.1 diguanylate cyclase [Echinicola strongylocentroti]
MKHLKNRPQPYKAPLKCWDIFAPTILIGKEKGKQEKDHQVMAFYKGKFNWNGFPDLYLHHYQALVLTDLKKKIVWVNAGFEHMTGYAPHDVIGKDPVFLQGPLTSPLAIKHIRTGLQGESPFKTRLLNYKKNQSTYICAIRIFPLWNKNGEITHLLALEKEE